VGLLPVCRRCAPKHMGRRVGRARECGLTLQSRGLAPASRVKPLISNVRHLVNVTLKLSEDEWGRKSLATEFAFEVPTKLLLYARFKNDLWWVKSSEWETRHQWAAQYHHLRDGTRQVIITSGAVLQNCIIPAGFDPETECQAEVEILKPSWLYRCGEHAVGIVAVPSGTAESLRNGIWRLKPTHMNESLTPFDEALSYSRSGHATGLAPYA